MTAWSIFRLLPAPPRYPDCRVLLYVLMTKSTGWFTRPFRWVPSWRIGITIKQHTHRRTDTASVICVLCWQLNQIYLNKISFPWLAWPGRSDRSATVGFWVHYKFGNFHCSDRMWCTGRAGGSHFCPRAIYKKLVQGSWGGYVGMWGILGISRSMLLLLLLHRRPLEAPQKQAARPMQIRSEVTSPSLLVFFAL